MSETYFLYPFLSALLAGLSFSISITNLFYVDIIRRESLAEKNKIDSIINHTVEGQNYFVGCLTEDAFNSWTRVSRYGYGVLSIRDDKVTFKSSYLFWPSLEIPLEPGKLQVKWIDQVLRNRFSPWFSIETQGETIYMTADINRNLRDLLNSPTETVKLYEQLIKLLQRNPT